MSEEKQKETIIPEMYMPSEQEFQRNLARRHRRGLFWQAFYYFSIALAILALITLFANVINEAFGSIATIETIPEEEVTGGRSLDELDESELAAILEEYVGAALAVIIRDRLSQVPESEFTSARLDDVIPNGNYPEGYEDATIAEIRSDENANALLAEILALNLSEAEMEQLVRQEVIELQVVRSWPLLDAIFNYAASDAELARLDVLPGEIETLEQDLADVLGTEANVTELVARRDALIASEEPNQAQLEDLNQRVVAARDLQSQIDRLEDERAAIQAHITVQVAQEFPDAEVTRFYSWLRGDFLTTPMSSTPGDAGIRTAILGSIYMMVIVILFTLPVGVGAAVYLEEYAGESLFNRVIETNVRNLAGVPSIIYGMLGLAILVRALAPITSGVAFGYNVNPPSDERIVSFINAVDEIDLEVIGLDTTDAGELVLDDTLDPFNEADYNLVLVNAEQEIAITMGETVLIDNDQALSLIETFRYYGTPSLTNVGNPPTERLMRSALEALAVPGEPSPDVLYDQIIAEVTAFTGSDTIFERLTASEINARINEVSAAAEASGNPVEPIDLDIYGFDIEQFLSLVSGLERISSFTVGGRTLISAALTLGLLILPIVIINAQEALRAVPYTIREASYGLGATKWQTIWRTVLPAAIPGILTGAILSVSRAVGETAPLIVVGASTFLLTDPDSPFSRFTVLPIQIYNWTARPQDQFRDIAAAAIIVLLLIMLTLNAVAIILRNRFSVRY